MTIALTDDEICDLLSATLHGPLPMLMQSRLMATAAECSRLRAANERLREGLRPFAEDQAKRDGPMPDDGLPHVSTITRADYRRARDLLEKP